MKNFIAGSLVMFCGECGTANPDTNKFCKNCGRPLGKPRQAPEPAATVPVIPAVPLPQPAGTVAVQPSPGSTIRPTRNWSGIASLILALTSWAVYPYIIAIIAIITGIYSLFRTRKKTGKIAWIALAGIVIALALILFNFFYLDIFAKALLPSPG
jgi:hypothetical protein